jgi:hypothetical protein
LSHSKFFHRFASESIKIFSLIFFTLSKKRRPHWDSIPSADVENVFEMEFRSIKDIFKMLPGANCYYSQASIVRKCPILRKINKFFRNTISIDFFGAKWSRKFVLSTVAFCWFKYIFFANLKLITKLCFL